MSNTRRAESSLEQSPSEGKGGTRDLAQPLRCLLCGGVRHRAVFEEFGVDILHCTDCGHVFSAFLADPHYDGFWGSEIEDQEHFYWNQARARMHASFFSRFATQPSGRLLDVGCGLGFFVNKAGTRQSWEAFGCEISPAAVRYAQQRLGLTNVQCCRPEDVDLPAASLDVVTLWDVIDHISQPDPVLARCYALLKTGGLCFIRTPNVSVQLLRARIKKLVFGMHPRYGYMMARDHCHYYSAGSIRQLLNRNGFRSVEFVHLPPIGASSRTRSLPVRICKSLGYWGVCAIDALTGGRLNFDNLFVVGIKES